MRWFKHFSDASEDEFIAWLEDEFGLEGYARWWKLLEVIAKQMKKPGQYSASYPLRLWCQYLVVRRPLLLRYLSAIEQQGRIKVIRNGDVLIIECRKLLEIKDNYQKDLEETSKPQASPNKEVEIEVEKEIEEDKEKDKEKDSTEPEKELALVPPIEVVIELPRAGKNKTYPVTVTEANQYQELYLAIDMLTELRKMKAWLIANPKKKPQNVPRFMVNWLNRGQDNNRTTIPSNRAIDIPTYIRCPKCSTDYARAKGACPKCGAKI